MAKVGERTKIWHPECSVIGEDTSIGEDCVIHAPVWIGNGVVIGNRVKIQAFAFIPDGVILEDDVFIGPHAAFTNDPRMAIKGPSEWETTIVHRGAKIGANASIRAGATIGRNAIVGMGAVVLHRVEEGQTVVGNPAKPLGEA